MGHRATEMRKVQLRTRSFITVGIFILGFAAFSFWGLSSQNNDFVLKIEQLEDNLKLGVRKQKDLEDQLETMMRKAADAQKSISRLQEDVKQKQTVIIAQADETSRWRDKLRTAEVEAEKLKNSVSEKEKQLENLQSELKSQGETKDKIIKEAENTITELRAQIAQAQNLAAQAPQAQGQNQAPAGPTVALKSSSSARPAVEANHVLAKPESPAEEPVMAEKSKGADDEPVGPKPAKPAEEVELIDADNNVIDSPAKGGAAGAEVEDLGNEVNLNEPNLINSQGDNLDEPQLVDQNAIRNGEDLGLPARRNKANENHSVEIDENLPEDQEIDDERGDVN